MSEARSTRAAVAGGGLGLSAAAVVWLYATFAQVDELRALRDDVSQVRKQVSEISTQVTVLDAIRQNQQMQDRRRYE